MTFELMIPPPIPKFRLQFLLPRSTAVKGPCATIPLCTCLLAPPMAPFPPPILAQDIRLCDQHVFILYVPNIVCPYHFLLYALQTYLNNSNPISDEFILFMSPFILIGFKYAPLTICA